MHYEGKGHFWMWSHLRTVFKFLKISNNSSITGFCFTVIKGGFEKKNKRLCKNVEGLYSEQLTFYSAHLKMFSLICNSCGVSTVSPREKHICLKKILNGLVFLCVAAVDDWDETSIIIHMIMLYCLWWCNKLFYDCMNMIFGLDRDL